MTDQMNAAVPMVGGRQDRTVPNAVTNAVTTERAPAAAKSREHYEPTTLAAPDVNGADRTIVIKPRRYVAVQLEGSGGPVRIELSVEQALGVGRALIDAAAKLDTPHAF